MSLFNNAPPPLDSRSSLRSWTRRIARTYGIRPRKRLSQNFIVEPMLIKTVINVLGLLGDIRVVELGSGIGTVSYYISRIPSVRYSIHFEIDELLCGVSEVLLGPRGAIICGNGLLHRWTVEAFFSSLPYHVTSDSIIKIARTNTIRRALIIVQKDVADRLTASPGTKEYGRLTILVTLLFKISGLMVLDPDAFWPPPKVYSQLLLLERVRNYSEAIMCVEKLTRILFNTRRRKVSKVLRRIAGRDAANILGLAGIGYYKRVYELTPGEVLRLAEILRERGLI